MPLHLGLEPRPEAFCHNTHISGLVGCLQMWPLWSAWVHKCLMHHVQTSTLHSGTCNAQVMHANTGLSTAQHLLHNLVGRSSSMLCMRSMPVICIDKLAKCHWTYTQQEQFVYTRPGSFHLMPLGALSGGGCLQHSRLLYLSKDLLFLCLC